MSLTGRASLKYGNLFRQSQKARDSDWLKSKFKVSSQLYQGCVITENMKEVVQMIQMTPVIKKLF